MDELRRCPDCGAEGEYVERYTVDRLGIRHWFQECLHCRSRRVIQRRDPADDNPYSRLQTPSWRPDLPPAPRWGGE